jgi:RND superfamily putative drug exporter
VIISLAGLWMVDNQALRSMALGAMVVVGVAILVAITLLPVLIRSLGHRVEAGGVTWSVLSFFRGLGRRRRRPGSTTPGAPTFWDRWTAAVMRRPIRSVVLAGSFLLLLASPVIAMKTGVGALDQFPEGHDVRVGNELAAQASGGSADSLEVLARFDEGPPAKGANAAAVDDLSARLAADPAVTRVEGPVIAGDAAMIEVGTAKGAESDETEAFVVRARDEIVPASAAAAAGTVLVGGEGARLTDVREQINSSLWKIIAFVLAFSFVVLMVMLRSIVLPLKAVLMNLLSVGAAYGVLIAIFQWGWLDGFLGFESLGAIDTLTPPLILAVVFGLSMDYEVFLLSRIKERYEAHGDNQRAVAEGLASSAGTISSAALIMASVFAVFALTGVPSIKELGVGNAVAIILDATLVRLILVPAAMQLFGDWNWWIPRWLDRILPHLDVEGSREYDSSDGALQLPQAQGRERDPATGNA